MADTPKPPRKFKLQPGEDVWTALARELVANPDSPTALKLQSQMNASMRPSMEAVEQLIEALAAQIEQPEAVGTQEAVTAAVAHWEKVCGGPLEDSLLADLRADARELVLRRRRQPPRLESIVAGTSGRSDVGYQLGLDVEGLRGTWHRLWAAIAMSAAWGESPEGAEAVVAIRAQFEQLLGRPLTPGEWDLLAAHGRQHGLTQMRPLMGGGGDT